MGLPNENQRVKRVIDSMSNGNELQFSKDIGISQPRINRLFKLDKRSNNYPVVSFEIIQAITNKFIKISTRWLINGEGDMLKSKNTESIIDETNNGVPLIPIEAMAGWGQGDVAVMDYEADVYRVPEFEKLKVDFMIKVKGSSMYPKYNSGDTVACRKIKLGSFFQWNKVYVLDTSQGAMVKRIKKSEETNHIQCVSDNKSYDPFDLPLEDLYSIALVVGVIRLE